MSTHEHSSHTDGHDDAVCVTCNQVIRWYGPGGGYFHFRRDGSIYVTHHQAVAK